MTGRTGRVHRGRYHSYTIDGVKVDGVTTILGAYPKPALANWAAKTTAEWVADNLNTSVRDLDRDALVDLAKGAPWRDRDQAANRGTEVHDLAEKLARGVEITWDEIPAEIRPHVSAYLDYRTDWHPNDDHVERVVINRAYAYCGTIDWLGTWDRDPAAGLVLLDYKTNRSGPFPEVALQLAAYRFAEAYLDDDGVEQPMPQIDTVAVLWLDGSGGYQLREVDAGPATFRQFLYVQQTHRFQNDLSATVLSVPKPVPALLEETMP